MEFQWVAQPSTSDQSCTFLGWESWSRLKRSHAQKVGKKPAFVLTKSWKELSKRCTGVEDTGVSSGAIAPHWFSRTLALNAKSWTPFWDLLLGYPPWNQHSTWKWMVGTLLSFWDGLFSGDMLVSRRVVSLKEGQKKFTDVSDNLDWLVAKNFRGELVVLRSICIMDCWEWHAFPVHAIWSNDLASSRFNPKVS